MSPAATSPLVEALDAQAVALAATGGAATPALAHARTTAREAALAHGVPTTRSERWKYTALRALAARRFEAPAGRPPVDLKVVADIPTPRLVIANGRYAPALSDLHALPEGLRVRLLSEVLRDAPAEAAAWLATETRHDDAAFQQWNGALADEGFVLEVEPGVRVATPLHLVVIGVEDGADRAFHLRHRIALGAGAALTVAKHHLGAGAHRHLLNTVLHVELGEGATLTQARVQREADGATLIQRTQATLGTNAHYRRLDLELGGALSRHELDVALAGDGAQLDANGVLLADGRRHLDTRLGIEHRAGNTRCELTWRGLGAQRGRAVFHGGILIAEGADGSNATLSNKNLLLDDGAEIDTQPVLVIHADDVQAAHGATVGRLDATALFYLRARGVPLAEATAMLTAAFLREPLAVLGNEALETALATTLDARLAAAASTRA
jgi:Fe-S cluster assembly protein SufD